MGRDRGAVGSQRFALFGGPLDSGNLGVSALGLSALHAIFRHRPSAAVTLFDNGNGARPLEDGDLGLGATVTCRGAWLSRRLHRTESLYTMYAACRAARGLNANVRVLSDADMILDLSGGDSFADTYGGKRFAQVTLPKRIALELGRPLVLLPQTYGPFHGARSRDTAARIVTAAAQAWARDAASFERLAELAGRGFDPRRHREGVDVAFALPARDPGGLSDPDLDSWLRSEEPVIGLNVSGLLFHDDSQQRFSLRADHRSVVRALAERLLEAGARVVLVPHVRGDSEESDDTASHRLFDELQGPAGLRILPPGLGARETKWIISQLSWFAGARMHATIAALSMAVPVAGIAYSDKMVGVFGTCGVADEVYDARGATTSELVDALWSAWERRDATGRRLRQRAPDVVARAESQFDEILGLQRHEAAPA